MIVLFYFLMPQFHSIKPYHLNCDPIYVVVMIFNSTRFYWMINYWKNSNILVEVIVHTFFTIWQIRMISHPMCQRFYTQYWFDTYSTILLLYMVNRDSFKESYFQYMLMCLIEITRSLWFWLTNYQRRVHLISFPFCL